MFSLVKESLRLANVNLRKEIHGDEKVLAVDLKLELETSNAVLLKFSPTLRDALYTQDPGATMDMINPDHAPTLRNPQMGEIKWDLEMPFVRFGVFADGTNEEEIVFSGAKCNNFKFHCREGGTVLVTFRIQKSEPLEIDVTKLIYLMDKSIKVSLEAEEEPEDYQGGEQAAAAASSEAGLFSSGESDQQAGEDSAGDAHGDEYDALYEKACAHVRGLNRVSVSMLQREFKISSLAATNLLNQMEDDGRIGEANGQGLHEVIAIPA